MLSFSILKEAITLNPHRYKQVASLRILPPMVEFIPFPSLKQESLLPKPIRIPPPLNQVEKASSDSEEEPIPTRLVGTKPSTVKIQEIPVQVKTTPTEVPKVQDKKEERERGKPCDPICIGIELQDSMYAIATSTVKQSIECEEARRLEALVDSLYKEKSGRSRGWTKTKLTEFLVPRAAAGGHVPAKQVFSWDSIWDKEGSALLDFVCLAKGIRIAVWKSDSEVALWPAADEGTPPLYHVSRTGVVLSRPPTSLANVKLLAPYSVLAGLEKLTLADLDSLAEKMGVTLPSGKKNDKAAFLASARMRMRIA